MSETNITLERQPTLDDYAKVLAMAAEPCDCTPEMIAGLVKGTEVMCDSCGARQVLNGLVTLAEEL